MIKVKERHELPMGNRDGETWLVSDTAGSYWLVLTSETGYWAEPKVEGMGSCQPMPISAETYHSLLRDRIGMTFDNPNGITHLEFSDAPTRTQATAKGTIQ